MRSKKANSLARLNEVRDSFFTIKGSPYFFFPKDKALLELLRKQKKGVKLNILFNKPKKDDTLIRVTSAKIYGLEK